MNLRRRRRHVLVDGADADRVFPALIWRGDREAAAAVWDAPRLLDPADPRVSRALRVLDELREGAPVNPEQTGNTRRPKIAVNLAESDARLRQLRAAWEAHLRGVRK